ncbi:MAG: hypothetical protein E7631_07610 [Ruminococcaceae bacterium]|nr:hypothetical protein [Oscillospiraceae bacterium]
MRRFFEGSLFWKILFFLGLCPFLIPFIVYTYEMLIGSGFTLADWLILYSFLYWWTYVIGLVFCVLAAVQLKRKKNAAADINNKEE